MSNDAATGGMVDGGCGLSAGALGAGTLGGASDGLVPNSDVPGKDTMDASSLSGKGTADPSSKDGTGTTDVAASGTTCGVAPPGEPPAAGTTGVASSGTTCCVASPRDPTAMGEFGGAAVARGNVTIGWESPSVSKDRGLLRLVLSLLDRRTPCLSAFGVPNLTPDATMPRTGASSASLDWGPYCSISLITCSLSVASRDLFFPGVFLLARLKILALKSWRFVRVKFCRRSSITEWACLSKMNALSAMNILTTWLLGTVARSNRFLMVWSPIINILLEAQVLVSVACILAGSRWQRGGGGGGGATYVFGSGTGLPD